MRKGEKRWILIKGMNLTADTPRRKGQRKSVQIPLLLITIGTVAGISGFLNITPMGCEGMFAWPSVSIAGGYLVMTQCLFVKEK
jgi:hypothetical protein